MTNTVKALQVARRRDRWLGVSVAVIATLVAVLRIPEELRDTLWAEDGALFLSDAAFGRAGLLTPYAGYLHVASRAAAQAAVILVRPDNFARVINGFACALNGLVAAIAFYCSRDVLTSLPPRFFVAGCTVLLPLMPVEVAGNLANVHGYFLWAAFWILLCLPRTRVEALVLSTCVLLATLSEVQTIVLLPLALLVFYQQRDALQRVVLAAYGLGLSAEIWAILHSARPSASARAIPPMLAVLKLYVMEVILPLWLVDTARISTLLEAHGYWIGLVCALPLLVALVLVLRYGERRTQLAAILGVGLSLSLFTIAHAMNYGQCLIADTCSIRVLNRYGPIPSLLALVLVALLIDLALRRKNRLLQASAALASAPLLFSAALNFEVEENRRLAGHAWKPQVPDARKECRENLEQDEVCLKISPRSWASCIPCQSLRKRSKRGSEEASMR